MDYKNQLLLELNALYDIARDDKHLVLPLSQKLSLNLPKKFYKRILVLKLYLNFFIVAYENHTFFYGQIIIDL